MKKTIFGKALALLAAGALVFGALGCDEGIGEKDFAPESPTTYDDLTFAEADVASSTVTAKWTFAKDTSGIGTAEVAWDGKQIEPDSGEGAYLIGGEPCVIKYVEAQGKAIDNIGANDAYIQASNKSASLEEPTKGASLKLITTDVTNITVRAAGAGAATSTRIFLMTTEDGTPLEVYKDNLASNGNGGQVIPFHVCAAPAGTYYIYFNGSVIYEIDCTAASGSGVTKPVEYTQNEDLTISSAPTSDVEALVDIAKFKLTETNGGADITNNAVWTIVEGKDIATVKAGVVTALSADSKGTVKVRARIGRRYVESGEFTFKAAEKSVASTFVAADLPAAASGDAARTQLCDWATTEDADGNPTDTGKILATKVLGQQLVEITDKYADITFGEKMKEIIQPEKGTYKLDDAGKTYTYTEDATITKVANASSTADAGKVNDGEFLGIKTLSGTVGGIQVKPSASHADEYFVKEPQMKSLEESWELITLKYKVKPVAGKSVKVTGVRAHLISGAVYEKDGYDSVRPHKIEVYKGETLLGSLESDKGSKWGTSDVAWIANFDSPVDLTGEETFTFKVVQTGVREKCQCLSLGLDDIGLVCEAK